MSFTLSRAFRKGAAHGALTFAVLGSWASRADAQSPARTVTGYRVLGALSEGVGDASASPNGKLLAIGGDSTFFVLNTVTGKTTRLLDDVVEFVKWSPAGDRIFAVRINHDDDNCYVWSVPVDAASGASKGEWRRVVVSPARSPFPSPDGKWVAYLKGDCGGPARLAIVPASGGQERVLTDAPVDYRIGWTPDSKWIYYGVPENAQIAVYRIAVSGGRPERIATANTPFPGLSNDGRYWFSIADTPEHGRLRVQAIDVASKRVVTASIPAMTHTHGWLNHGYRVLASNQLEEITAVALPSTGGAPRRLFSVAGSFQRNVSASPDGKSIAWAWGTPHGVEVSMTDANGQNRRVLDTISAMNDFGEVLMKWSPDSRLLAYADGLTNLRITSATDGRRVAAVAAPVLVAHMQWSPDSRRLRYVRHDGTPTARRISVHELSVDGSDRLALDLSSYKAGPGLQFLDFDRILAFRAGLVHHIGSTRTTRIFDESKATESGRRPVRSGDGMFEMYVGEKQRSVANVVSTIDGTSRTVQLPLTLPNDNSVEVHMDQKGETLYAVRQATLKTPGAVYRVPVGGGAATQIFTAPARELIGGIELSPDGRTVYIQTVAPPTTTLLEVDLGPVLRGGASAPGR